MIGYSLEKVIEIIGELNVGSDEKQFNKELKEIIEAMKEQSTNKSCILSGNGFDEIIYNYIIEWAVWGLTIGDEQHVLNIDRAFCLQISNTLLSIYKLVKDGLDYQALCLVRVLLEMSISYLAILLDDNLRMKYFETKDIAKEKKIWNTSLRFNQMEEVVLKYCEEISEEVFKENPYANKIYKEMYHELSRYEHNSYLNIVLHAYAATDTDTVKLNIHGNKVTRVEMVLKEAFIVMVFVTAVFFRLLLDKNMIARSSTEKNTLSDELCQYAMVLHCMTEKLSYAFIEEYENNKFK